MGLSKQIGDFFGSFTLYIYRHAWTTIAIMLCLSLSLVSQLSRIQIDTSAEGFFHEGNPIIKQYNEFKEQFGQDDFILLALNPPDVFNLDFLKKLKEFHEDIENNVPYVSKITSMLNARSTIGREDELIVEDLLEDWPENKADLAVLKKRVLSNPLYQNSLISKDGKFTTITIEPNSFSVKILDDSDDFLQQTEEELLSDFEDSDTFSTQNVNEIPSAPNKKVQLTDEEKNAQVNALIAIVSKYKGPGFHIYLAGSPILDHEITVNLQRDMARFMGMAILATAIFLAILFRRVSGVLLPLLVVILSLLSTLGLMALLGTAITVPTQILPSFLLAVGIADSVHVLTAFYRHLKQGDTKETAIISAMNHSGRAILLTSLTTAAGLLSFITAELAPVSDLGVFAPVGVILTLLYTIILLPALLAVIPLNMKSFQRKKSESKYGLLENTLAGIGDFAIKHRWSVVTVSVLLILVSLYGSSRLKFSYKPLTWLPKEATARKDTEVIDQNMRGSMSLEVVADAGIKNGWYDPDLLSRLEQMGNYAKRFNDGSVSVGQTSSLVDILKEINQALNENRQEFYTIPKDENLVAQEFLIFENSGSDDLENVVDSQFSKARFTIKLPTLDAVDYADFIKIVEKQFQDIFGDKVKIIVTGIVALLLQTIDAMIISMARSYIIAIIIISLLMIILIGNIRIGLISMIPNLAPIIYVLGIMGWLNIPLDAFTLLIGSIAIGLVVDDTIHFLDKYKHALHATNDSYLAIHQTLQTTGSAIVFTSLVLSSGFFVYVCSSMQNLVNFGLLTGLLILLALIADLILLPALLIIFMRKE